MKPPVIPQAEPPEGPEAGGAAEPGALVVRQIPEESLGLRRVPHTTSLLECAARSGHEAVIAHVVAAYKARQPQCLRWQYSIGHGLWNTYPLAVQVQIQQHLPSRGLLTVEVDVARCQLDLATLQHRVDGAAQQMRWQFQTFVQYRDREGPSVACTPSAVKAWERAAVVDVGAAAACAPDFPTAQQLYQEGVLDPALWTPPCKDEHCRGLHAPQAAYRAALKGVQTEFLTEWFGVAVGIAEGPGAATANPWADYMDLRRGPRESLSRRLMAQSTFVCDNRRGPAHAKGSAHVWPGKSGFSTPGGGGGSIEPPKTGGSGKRLNGQDH